MKTQTTKNRLEHVREQVGATRIDASEAMGISYASVRLHELGMRLPSPEVAQAYSVLYGVRGWDLFHDLTIARRSASKIPNRFRELRESMSLTSAEASKLVGLPEKVNEWCERGGVPTGLRLMRYAALYKVTEAELYVQLPTHTPGD